MFGVSCFFFPACKSLGPSIMPLMSEQIVIYWVRTRVRATTWTSIV
jgi:hypothetical protein